MKRWVWYVIGAIVLALAGGGVLYGVLTHKEPGLMQVCWVNGQAHYTGTCTELKWQKNQLPLTYFITLDKNTETYRNSITKGADLWNSEIGPMFKLVNKESDAIVKVSWGSVPTSGHSGGYTSHAGTTGPTGATIVLSEPSDLHAVYRYATHEFGHVLGLAHDEAPRSIMYPTQPGMTNELTFVLPSDADKKLLRGLYR